MGMAFNMFSGEEKLIGFIVLVWKHAGRRPLRMPKIDGIILKLV
jgi:hypothetical protein